MRDGEFYDILDDLERAYDTNAKYLNLVLEHAMEDEYWFSRGLSEKIKEKLLKLLGDNHGIHIRAKLIYGLPYSDLPEEILGEVNEMLDNGELDYASPYYDAPRDRWIVGVEITAWKKGHYDLGYEISQIDDEIPEVLVSDDIDLSVYVTPHVY